MAYCFYIPDQVAMLRRAFLQEQKILRARQREYWWKLFIIILLEAVRQSALTDPNRCDLCKNSNLK